MTVSIVIPVGPLPAHRQWLDDAVASALAQTVPANVLLIDDMAGIPWSDPQGLWNGWDFRSGPPFAMAQDYPGVMVWRSPWRLGIPAAFNVGVAQAPDEEVLMLGADDVLESDAIESYVETSSRDAPEVRANTYYSLPVRYMDTGVVQYEPCNAAVVSKTLWRSTGGFPPESASGAPDAAFLSQIWRSERFRVRCVSDRPLYNYRVHLASDTAARGPWQGVILETRNLLTQLFQPDPRWGRFE